MPGLEQASRIALKCPPILLNQEQAEILVAQFRETASFRQWHLYATAVMVNHTHLVVGVPGDPDPSVILRDFKSYGSRALNSRWQKPGSGTWWTEGGSKRKLSDEAAVLNAVDYVVRRQFGPLVIWTAEDGERGA